MKPSPATVIELDEVKRANESNKPAIVFVHGLWLLSGSWDPWRAMFEAAGYVTLAPSWPDDPLTVDEGRRDTKRFAGKGIGAITDHYALVLGSLRAKPAIIGHSFGGLIAEKLAGRGLASATVAIDPAPFRGVLPLPLSSLKAASPVLRNPANRKGAVMLTYEQFRYGFANAVGEDEAKQLYADHAVPGSGLPLFQAGFANLNPASEASVDSLNRERGPMKFISGERDHIVPWVLANASFKRQRRNAGVTEIEEMPNRGHSLVIDGGWDAVARAAKVFLDRFATPS